MEQKRPMMYIKQPTFRQVGRRMQNVAIGNSANKEKMNKNVKKVSTRSSKSDNTVIEQNQTPPSSEQQETEQKEVSVKKRFYDMSLEEKLQYLYHSIPGVTKLKAEFYTLDDEVYRGIIVDLQDNKVELRNMHAPFKATLTIERIKDVRLLGF